ncbi:MAG: hypothetical protein WD801_01335 [Gemmatimonadaceae bacterium]
MHAPRLALLVVLLVACAREEGGVTVAEEAAVAGETGAATATAPDACPATGQWTPCAILQRLERSGMAPQQDSGGASEASLSPRGLLVRVGRAELELYIYPDAAAREREQSTLDRTRYVDYAASQTFRAEPTLISSANMIAILHSNNSKQRERLGDAITAGPPQPARP